MIFPNFEHTSKTREAGMCREEQGDSGRVGKSRFNTLCSVAKNGKKKKEKNMPFILSNVSSEAVLSTAIFKRARTAKS